tara:strand:+ start:72 stop:899 length:828 start_codon:yes stop_codon:yes gene_type:complete
MSERINPRLSNNLIKSEIFKKNNSDIRSILRKKLKIKNFLIIESENDRSIQKNIVFISKCLGNLVSQNKNGIKLLKIKPKKNIKTYNDKQKKKILRYHQTNLGGSIHSDGPQLDTPPNYVAMACLNQAEKGGSSVLTDTRLIFRYLNNKNKEVLNILKKKFPFEKRGFFKNGKLSNKIILKPIFEVKNRTLRFRYLRDYIESGYRSKNYTITKQIKKSFNVLDSLLEKKRFIKKFKLNKGDILILDNRYMAHGRTKFQFDKKGHNSRVLLRTWIK